MKIKQHRAIAAGHIALMDGKFVSLHFHPNGQPKFGPSGMMLDENGNRSIFDDIDDDGTADQEYDDGEIDF